MLLRTMTFGRLLTIVSICIAILAMFFPWVDVQIQTDDGSLNLSKNGFSRQSYFLLLFLLYPIYCVVKKRAIHKILGISFAAILLVITYTIVEMQVFIEGETTINANGLGINIFLVSNCLFFISVLFKNDSSSNKKVGS